MEKETLAMKFEGGDRGQVIFQIHLVRAPPPVLAELMKCRNLWEQSSKVKL